MIPAARHIFLMLCNPVHSVTAFELPVYHPSEQERRDPRLYAANVRKLMVSRARRRPGSGCRSRHGSSWNTLRGLQGGGRRAPHDSARATHPLCLPPCVHPPCLDAANL